MNLQESSPIGKWVFRALEENLAANEEGTGKYTAPNFLQFLIQFKIIFLKDMAVTW